MSRTKYTHEHQPQVRRLESLTNKELTALLATRSAELVKFLNDHTFWHANYLTNPEQTMPRQIQVYEIMLEIQSRYPTEMVHAVLKTSQLQCLPVMEIRDAP